MNSGNLHRQAELVVFALVTVTSPAMAGFTPINPPVVAGELNHQQILQGLYGGTFTPSGVNFVGGGGGSISALRMDDFGVAGFTNITTGAPGTSSDGVWSDGIASASAKAVYAADHQTFGFFPGSSGGSFTQLFDVSGTGFGVTGSTVHAFGGQNWRWGRSGNANVHSSLASENPGNEDHLVTYKVTGLTNGAAATWLLFWEDRNAGQSPGDDFDYNDLVVEVSAVPVPLAASMSVVGLGWVASLRRRAIK